MNRLIRKILEAYEYRFDNLSSTEKEIIFVEDTKRSSYYLVVFKDDIALDTSIVGQLNEYFELVKSLPEKYEPQMDKNLSMVVCVKRKNLNPDSTLNKLILDIEEDPYFFKKYVLTYTVSQVEMVLNRINEKDIISYLHSLIYDEKAFQDHKEDPNTASEYNLVSKLFIKIPILNLGKINRELASIEGTIKTKLLQHQLLQLSNELLSLRENEINDEELYKNILNYLKSDGND